MKTLNLKPQFFEMVIKEPVLQIEIANKFSSEAEFVESLAVDENEFLALPGIREIIANSYNQSMPEHLKITPDQTLNEVYTPHFHKSFVDLYEV